MTPSPPLRPLPMKAPPPGDVVARRARWLFVVSVALTLLLYWLPAGRRIAYPLVLVSTLAHETGHGLAAILVGAKFEALRIYPDGSGVAMWRGDVGRFAQAFIAAGGLVGPAVAAFVLLWLGKVPRRAMFADLVLGALLIVACALVVRNWFGLFFVLALAAALIAIALMARDWVAQLALVFLATQLGLAVFSRGDYLFTKVAETANGPAMSDVAEMSESLFLPYWIWGLLCGGLSVLFLLLGMAIFLRGTRSAAVRPAGGRVG